MSHSALHTLGAVTHGYSCDNTIFDLRYRRWNLLRSNGDPHAWNIYWDTESSCSIFWKITLAFLTHSGIPVECKLGWSQNYRFFFAFCPMWLYLHLLCSLSIIVMLLYYISRCRQGVDSTKYMAKSVEKLVKRCYIGPPSLKRLMRRATSHHDSFPVIGSLREVKGAAYCWP